MQGNSCISDSAAPPTPDSVATLVPLIARVSGLKIVKNAVLQNFNLTSLHQHSIFSAGTFD
jgi:hypothetical protein